MDPFALSAGGELLRAVIPSPVHGDLSFTISTLTAGNLSLRQGQARENYLRRQKIPVERVTFFHQTHSKTVAVVTSRTVSPVPADGGATIAPDVILSITVADCIPILLFDRAGGGYALLHSGWKGTGIAAAALETMRGHFGTEPGNVTAVIGPGIGGCCYNVPEERAAGFSMLGSGVVTERNGMTYLDLKEANHRLLENAGVQDIRTSAICTCCSGYLGSYRRQGPAGFTSMLAVVGHF
ncbi:MAG: laccase domain-containing protein [Spirochaetales bacterium]|nr:laccase domain-containing protein [Spirochaetales bacterium]